MFVLVFILKQVILIKIIVDFVQFYWKIRLNAILVFGFWIEQCFVQNKYERMVETRNDHIWCEKKSKSPHQIERSYILDWKTISL